MRKLFFFTFLLLLFAACSQAQSGSSDANKPAPNAMGMTTLTGCLVHNHGEYTVVSDDGTEHMLSGAASKLKPEVGHTVEVTGKRRFRTIDTTTPGNASSATEQPYLEVKTVKLVGTSCRYH